MHLNHNIDPYQALGTHLNEAPLGAPQGEELLAILRELFTPEQAGLAALLPFKPSPLNRLSRDLGFDSEELAPILAEMADHGLVFERRRDDRLFYSLLPILPGLSEVQFMDGQVSQTKYRLAALFSAYYRPGIGPMLGNAALPYGRVLPVRRTIPLGQEILPYQQAEEFIRDQRFMCLHTCYCRHEAELNGHGCGKPKDVCMSFGPFAEFLVAKGFSSQASEHQMLSALDRAEEAGLVHVVDNIATGVNFICNCCSCCCMFLKTVNQLDSPGAVAPAAYQAFIDPDECVNCGECLDVCPVEAISHTLDSHQVDPTRCLGCGQCSRTCPSQAIEMHRKEDWSRPAASLPELFRRLSPEKRENFS
jgi:ferredoxin